MAQRVDRSGDRQRAGIGRRHHRCGPQQRDRLGRVANIVATHPEQHGVDPRLDEGSNLRGLYAGQVEIAGQRRHRPAAIGIGRRMQIIDDQLELRIAPPRVDQRIEKRGKGLHG